jgi:hypothetical protein
VGRDNLFGTGLLNAKAAVGNSLTSARPADIDVAPTTTTRKQTTIAQSNPQ